MRCAEMGTTTRSGGGARAPSASTAPYAAAQATPPAPPLALPSPPARGSREGARGQSLAPGGGGGVPFQGRRAPKSRRDSAKHVAKAPQVPPESLKRTWDYVARMDKDGVTDALFGPGAEIIPLGELKSSEGATKRFQINDLYQTVCTRALSRMKQHGVLEDGAPSDERPDGPRCKCGARMVVSLSDAVQYWVDETNPGTSPYFTSTEAGAADAARRGWRRIQPKHHHGPAAKVAANASAVEKVHREDDVEGCFSEYLPTFNRETLVAAVQDGFVNPATGASHAPLRLWTLERRQAAWRKAGLDVQAAKTVGKRFNALLAMYWALTHDVQLQEKFGIDTNAGAKRLEEAGGKMMSALGKSRFELVSEHATEVVRVSARGPL